MKSKLILLRKFPLHKPVINTIKYSKQTLLLLLAFSMLFSQNDSDNGKRAIITKQISKGKIQLDGLLNDPEWGPLPNPNPLVAIMFLFISHVPARIVCDTLDKCACSILP